LATTESTIPGSFSRVRDRSRHGNCGSWILFSEQYEGNKKKEREEMFLDSGASEHVCADESEMELIEPFKDIIRIKTVKTGIFASKEKRKSSSDFSG
jgi:hypothetical protein